MADFSRKGGPEREDALPGTGQTEEIADGLEWIESPDGSGTGFRSEVEITEEEAAEPENGGESPGTFAPGEKMAEEEPGAEEGESEKTAGGRQDISEGSGAGSGFEGSGTAGSGEKLPEQDTAGEPEDFMPDEEAILAAAGAIPEKRRGERYGSGRPKPAEERPASGGTEEQREARPESRTGRAEEPGERDRSRARGRSRRRGTGKPAPERGDRQGGRRRGGEGAARGKTGFDRRRAAVAAGAAAAVLAVGGIAYTVLGQKYDRVFFPGTQINGLDVSGKTAEEAEQMIAEGINGYVLTIEERGGNTEQITQADIGLRAEFDGTMEEIIAAQTPLSWGAYVFSPASYKIRTMMVYDEEAFRTAVEALSCFDEEKTEEPVNARLSEYVPGTGYTIVPEKEGTRAVYDVVEAGISEAILKLEPGISIEEIGGYEEPEITSEDETLRKLCGNMNRAAGVTVTYKFGDASETLSGDRIHEWLVQNADGTVGVDAGKVSAYVEELADKYDTANKAKKLKTSYGPTVTIRGGTYGWKINRSAEAGELAALIKAGESQSGREPVYSQKAASRGENDYGNTYVEINLTAQHLFFYKDGALLVESDFVSGNLAKGWGTPAGAFPLTYKQRDAVLKGEGYRTPVDYWMPFNGGIGMHDATWRSSFGGTIYKTNGSHGCVNLPHSVAEKIYENIQAGMPVLCYNLEGTEKAPEKPKETEPATQAPVQPGEPATQAPVQPGEPATQAPVQPSEPAETSAQIPSEPATQPAQPPSRPSEPSSEAGPAGPGSDTGNSGNATGPGAV